MPVEPVRRGTRVATRLAALRRNDASRTVRVRRCLKWGLSFIPRRTALIPRSCAGFSSPLPDFIVISGASRGHGARAGEDVYRLQRCPRALLYLDSYILLSHHLPYPISSVWLACILARYGFAPARAWVCEDLPPEALHLFLQESPCRLRRQPARALGRGKHVPAVQRPSQCPVASPVGVGIPGVRRSAAPFPGWSQPGPGRPVPRGALGMARHHSGAV